MHNIYKVGQDTIYSRCAPDALSMRTRPHQSIGRHESAIRLQRYKKILTYTIVETFFCDKICIPSCENAKKAVYLQRIWKQTGMISEKLDKERVQRAAELMAVAQRIVILTHMAPDGDAMGSALGMYHYLSASRQQPAVSVVVPNAFPAFYAWMPGADKIRVYENEPEACGGLIAEADLIVCTDFNDPKRIGVVGEKLQQNPCPKIMIDHHPSPTDFAEVTLSYPETPSASEIVYRLLCAIGSWQTEANKETATCIYTGMMTDTGNFSFNSNYPEMYEIVADLVSRGVDKDAVYNAVFNQYSADRVRLMGYALYRKMRIYPDRHVALITLSADELDRYHYKVGDTEGLVNMPLQIADVYYSVFMREERAKPGTPHSRIRISFRSQGDRPVNVYAQEVFRGGGHPNASGGELYGTIEQAVKRFLATYKKYLGKI